MGDADVAGMEDVRAKKRARSWPDVAGGAGAARKRQLIREGSSLRAMAEMHEKLCLDPNSLVRKGKLGGMALFDSTLEQHIGSMDGIPLRGMLTEHCHSPDSHKKFNPANAIALWSTPEKEFYFVVGEDGVDQRNWKLVPGAQPTVYEGALVEGRVMKSVTDLQREPQAAVLRDVEIVALRLYCGPMYAVYNSILRAIVARVEGGEEDCAQETGANYYPTTIQLIVSGILKLCRHFDGTEPLREVFRGLSVALPQEFFEPGPQMCAGGVEPGFMSTTTKRAVAVAYSGAHEQDIEVSTLFRIALDEMSQGADVSWLSQFPGENERLFPPWTHLQIMGEPVQSDDGVTEIVLRPTLYQNVTTVEDAERSRKAGVEHLISSLTWDLRHIVRQDQTRAEGGANSAATADALARIDAIEAQMLATHSRYEPGWFEDNMKYKSTMLSLLKDADEARESMRDHVFDPAMSLSTSAPVQNSGDRQSTCLYRELAACVRTRFQAAACPELHDKFLAPRLWLQGGREARSMALVQDALRSKGVGLIALQREMDANGDGNISSREFRAAVNRVKGLNVTEQEVMDVYHHLLDQRQAAVAAGVAAGEGAEAASPAKDARLTGEEAKPPETAAVEGTGRWNKIKHAVGFVAAAKPNLTMAEIIQFFAGVAPAAAAGATVSPVPSTAEHVAPTAAAASAPAIGGAAVTQSAAAADAANVEEGGRVREGRGFDLEVMAHRLRAAGVEGLLGCMDLAYVRGMWHEHTQAPSARSIITYSIGGRELQTTPEREWLFVVGPDGIDTTAWAFDVARSTVTVHDASMRLPGRNFKTLSALEQTASAQKAQLLPAEIVAVRLFSGPMGVVYNGILEGRAEEGGGGGGGGKVYGATLYTTTVHVLVSALRKLARVSIPPRDFLAYRLPGARTSDPETGAAGVQLPFLSATRNRRVAVERALARIEREAARVCGVAGERLQQEGVVTLEAIEMGKTSIGADISELSQFEHEEEVVFPPHTFVHRNGKPALADDGAVLLVPLTLTINQRTSLVHQAQEARKHFLHNLASRLTCDVRHWAAQRYEAEAESKATLLQRLRADLERQRGGMRALLEGVSTAKLNDNSGFGEVFEQMVDLSEEERYKIIHSLRQEAKALETGKRQVLAMHGLENAIDGAQRLLSDSKTSRDLVIDMQRELVYLNPGPFAGLEYAKKLSSDRIKLANLLRESGRYAEALDLYETVLWQYAEAGNGESGDAALCRYNMGNLLCDQNKHEEALLQYEQALAIRRKLGAQDTREVAADYSGIGVCHFYLKRYEAALMQHRAALEIRRRVLGCSDEETASTYNHIGMCLQEQGLLDEAILHYQRALDIKKLVLGPDHHSVGLMHNNMGLLHEKQGHVDRALKHYDRSLDIKVKVFGLRHKAVMTGYYNMACLYASRDVAKCEEMLGKAEETGCLKLLAEHMCADPDLNPIRDLGWFAQLLERLSSES